MATDDELAAKDALYFQQVELQATLRTLENESQKREAIHTFIRESAQNANVICPDFQQGLLTIAMATCIARLVPFLCPFQGKIDVTRVWRDSIWLL